MPKRVSSVTSVKENYIDSKVCLHCHSRTLPIRYKGGIASHFICKGCGAVQVDKSNPYLDSIDSREYERRKDSGLIKAKSGNVTNLEDIVIGTVKPEYKRPLEFDMSDDVEVLPNKNSSISYEISKALNTLEIKGRMKERYSHAKLREIFGRSLPNT